MRRLLICKPPIVRLTEEVSNDDTIGKKVTLIAERPDGLTLGDMFDRIVQIQLAVRSGASWRNWTKFVGYWRPGSEPVRRSRQG